MSNTRRLSVGAVAFALLVSACAGSAEQTNGSAIGSVPLDNASVDAVATGVTEAPTAIDVKSGSSALGEILVGPDGMTLYAFTNDVDALSACYGTCADAWPPVIVDVDWTAGPGLDFGIFATAVRDDGQLQLVAGQWPLYYFAGDGAPGDLKGQGSGDVWFAVDLDGRLITDPAPDAAATDDAAPGGATLVAEASTDLGPSLVDAAGLTLYGFLNDTDGSPTCDDACAETWPPVIVDGPDLPEGLDPAWYSVVERNDGTFQLSVGRWPLYRFSGDGSPGDVNGQGSGEVWFVAAPDGSLIGAPSGAEAEVSDAADGGGDGY